MNNKILIISIALLSLIILVGIYWLERGDSYFTQFLSPNYYIKNKSVVISPKWLIFQNKKYGFEIKYPEKVVGNNQGIESLKNATTYNTLVILNKNNNFYLTQEYRQEFDWHSKQFIKIKNTFVPAYKGVADYGIPWHITIVNIANENELDKLIKQKYGSGCSYQEKYVTSFVDTFDIKIKGDEKDMGLSKCVLNYEYHLKYSPKYKRAAFWQTGQECILGSKMHNCYDEQISNSFHFIN